MPQGPRANGDTSSAGSYSATRADVADDEPEMLALWQHGLAQQGMPEAKFDWFYRSNPEGVPDVFFLRHETERDAVGVAAVGRRRMRFGAETLLAGQLVDFVVQPQHRALFPAMFLQKQIRSRGLESCAMLFGLPNPKSAAVFRRVGYRCVGQMVRRVRVLRSCGYLQRYLPALLSRVAGSLIDGARLAAAWLPAGGRFRTQWLDRPDSRFDDLWARAAAPDVLIGVRDTNFLTWRFVDCPHGPYSFFSLASTADQRLLAYAACEQRQPTLHVRDFLVDPGEPGVSAQFWRELSLEAFRLGYASLSVEFLGGESEHGKLEAAGLRARDERPLYAAARDDWTSLMHGRNWYLTCADEDG
jgi:hypothetical protein